MQEMLEVFNKPSMLHAAVVHLPIALISVGVPLLILAALLHKNLTLRVLAALTFVAAAALSFLAAESGERANDHVPPTLPEAISDIKVEHMDLGHRVGYAAAATALLALLSLLPLREVRVGLSLLSIVASLYSLGLVAYTAHLGGELVYDHGVGTPHMEIYVPKPAGATDGAAPSTAAVAPAADLVPIQPIDLAAAKKVSYVRDVRPILVERCLDCHDSADADGAFDVSTVAAMMKGGEKGGPGVVAGKPDESSIVQYIRGEKTPRMPKKKKPLAEEDLHLIRQWIAAGAVDDSAAEVAAPAEPTAATPELSTAPSAEAPAK